jgi:hypothetical protein
MMEDETWMTATEAKNMGFINNITKGGPNISNVSAENDNFLLGDELMVYNSFDFNGTKLKEKLLSIYAKSDPAQPVENSIEGGINVSYADIIAKLPDTEKTAITSYIASQVADAVAKAIEPLNGTITTLTNELAETKAKLPQEEDPTAKAMANLPDDIKAILEASNKAKKDAEDALAQLQTEKAVRAFKDQLSIFDALPIEGKHVEALYALSATKPEHFKDLEGILKVANAAMKTGFTATGTERGKDVATGAYAEIESRVSKLRAANDKLDYNDAFRQVVASDPELYEKYREETYSSAIV